MSRIAKYPVDIPAKVEVALKGGLIEVKGPLGSLSRDFGGSVKIERKDNQILFSAANGDQHSRAMSGTCRALVNNMVRGVSEGFSKKLTLVGVGFRAQAAGDTLNLSLGFSHPVAHKMPAGVKVVTPTQTEILISGADRQQVGQVAAEVRAYRPPEPYKGKGVRYADEVVTLKETKKK
ncbi:50S ribosomal protein L6 [Casimicrobium huifangae]|jgi:large subunit ribosomal protein L6|uniref:50S ribosomal protein L6 n=1 Tax=Casimicrobium huifangae TaxID=2591109 RepID=UPI0012EBB81B|nr:50S ribosomal protein L6 [Casimicrobium huifangae]HOB02571.1 50S ribosomal protein L6 [Casimicrobium huifangae]HQA33642.1 50S ribosomal protein L6 [Casimicrobium huifangae]